MGRRLFGVALLAGAIAGTPAVATAQPVPAAGRSANGSKHDVSFRVARVGGDYTMTAESRGLTFFKRVGASTVVVRVQVPGDVVEVEANSSGAARFTRNGKDVRFVIRHASEADAAKLQRLASGSRALAAFEGMMAATSSTQTPEARSLATSYALVQAVRGNSDASRSLALSVKPESSSRLTRASSRVEELPAACWADYAAALYQYMVELNNCYYDYGWIPGMGAVCAFEFSVKAELAWFWVIACSGGVPV